MMQFRFSNQVRYFARNLADVMFHAFSRQSSGRVWGQILRNSIDSLTLLVKLENGPNITDDWAEHVDFKSPVHLSAVEAAITKTLLELNR